jgi:dTDP-4-dehydrorhamnose 3,5-epimerase
VATVNVSRLPALPELLLFEPPVFRDARGTFRELYNAERYAAAGLEAPFVQDNLSESARHVLRGLHLQHPRGQGKLVTVAEGAVWDVAVDVRLGSPSFGRWAGVELSAENARQLWIPPGFAHGFVVLTARALFAYKCTALYSPADELTVRWDDPGLGIDWPVAAPLLSSKDAAAPALADIDPGRLPVFATGAINGRGDE